MGAAQDREQFSISAMFTKEAITSNSSFLEICQPTKTYQVLILGWQCYPIFKGLVGINDIVPTTSQFGYNLLPETYSAFLLQMSKMSFPNYYDGGSVEIGPSSPPNSVISDCQDGNQDSEYVYVKYRIANSTLNRRDRCSY